MITVISNSHNKNAVDSIWKDRIERALKHVSRAIDLRQRDDVVPILKTIAEQYNDIQRPRVIGESTIEDVKSSLYTSCSYDEINGDKLIAPLTILPQVDQLPMMFTYVPLQSNFLCDTITNLSDLLMEEDSEDVKNLLISIQSDSLTEQQQSIRSTSSSKRTRRLSKTSFLNDRNNEFIFDEEHLLELFKRLKQQSDNNAFTMTIEDETNLFDTLLKLYPSSADLIRDRFGTVFESKRLQPKEFTPNIDIPSTAVDTSVENILHSYFMLFCRRCHRYDCFLHRDKPIIPDLKNRPKYSNIDYRPCNPNCYRRKVLSSYQEKRNKLELKRSHSEFTNNKTKVEFKNGTNGFYSKRLKSSTNKTDHPSSSLINSYNHKNGFIFKPTIKRKLDDGISNWLSNDKSLFRIFHTIFRDNICMIADLLDKPCSEVYTFYINELKTNEKNLFLQRDSSVTNTSNTESSSNSTDNKVNGEHKKKNLKHKTFDSNHDEELADDKTKTCNPQSSNTSRSTPNHCPSRRSHFSSFRRQRSHQQLLINHHNLLLEQKRHTYYPCDHDRSLPCNEDCYCVHSGNFCEKYCCCTSAKCDNRFPGCRCRSSCTTKQCPCYAAARECDPDLCTQCGADDFHNDGINNDNESGKKSTCSCHNIAIQRSLHKPLLLAESDVAGWGIFTQVNIQRNEFIAEYCGEILTQDEGELRGRMYDKIGTSFLFDLNEEYMVDATRRGNKIRFANHSINPNCYAKVIMVNGDHRIGIYSKRFISAGEELFFDYRYGANHHLRFVGVEKYTIEDPVDALLL